MPIYEYQCQACGHQLEALQKVNDAPLIKCSQCNQEQLQKRVSAVAFQLKGSGWYVTDFKDKKEKSTNSDTSETTNNSDTKAETSSSRATTNAADSNKKATSTTSSDD